MQMRLQNLIAVALLGAVCFSAVISVVAAADPDFYQILGVAKDATERQMKKAYHKLSSKWHPDKAKNDEDRKIHHEKFVVISRAYQVLSNPEKRRIYDMTGKDPDSAEAQQQQYNPWGMRGHGGGQPIRVNMADFGFGGFGFDFGDLFGHPQAQHGEQRQRRGGGGRQCVQSVTCRGGMCTTTTTCT